MRLYSIFLILLVILCAPALGEYTQVGGESYRFQADDADIIGSTDIISYSAPTIEPIGAPLYADLNQDGTREIVVGGKSDVYLYNYTGTSIQVENSAALAGSSDVQPVIHNVDSDPYLEVIADDGGDIRIFEYNGTGFYTQTNFSISFTLNDQHSAAMGCYKGSCYAVNVGDADIDVSRFNASGETATNLNSWDYGNYYTLRRMPYAPTLHFADVDSDGYDDLAFGTSTYVRTGACGQYFDNEYWSEGHYYELDLSISGHGLAERVYRDQNNDDCMTDEQERFRKRTNVIWGNGDGIPSNGKELITVAYDEDGRLYDSYVVSIHDTLFSRITTIPTTSSINHVSEGGTPMISNPMNSDFFPNTGANDVCYMIYDVAVVDENGTIDNSTGEAVFCASYTTDSFYNWQIFEVDQALGDGYDYTRDDLYNMMAHAMDTNTNPEEFSGGLSNVDEVLSHQGILNLDWDSSAKDNVLLGNYHYANIVYELPRTFGAVAGFDYENVSRADMILLMPQFVYYLDDGFVNRGGEIDSYIINPCLDYAWLTNETVKVTVGVKDQDGDPVQARAKLYAGRTYEQDSNWSDPFGSGSSQSFFFTANRTTSSADLVLMGRDTENPDDVDTITLNFQVSGDGIEYGFCTTTEDGLTEPAEDEEDEAAGVPGGDTVTADDNAIKRSLDAIKGDSGLSNMVIWILTMAIVAWGIITQLPGSMTHNHMFSMVAIVEVLLLVLGVHLGFITSGVLVVLVILVLGGAAMWLRQRVTGSWN